MFDLPNSEDNKRSGYRCPCPEPRTAKLTIHMGDARNETHEIVVLDESMGGFGVLIDGAANLGPTRCAILDLGDKEVICQITNVRRVDDGMRLGLRSLEEVNGDPIEAKSAAKVGKANYVTKFGTIGPLILAFVILIGSVIGFICYESTKVYKDKFGRKQQGSASTAFKKIGSWFTGQDPEL